MQLIVRQLIKKSNCLKICCFIFILIIVSIYTASAKTNQAPRVILALYNGVIYKDIQETLIHRMAEMPLNHLGLIVKYHDINKGLPALDELGDVRGVMTWFQSNTMPNPLTYLAWAEAVIDAGKRFVIFDDPAVSKDLKNKDTPIKAINHFLAKLGLQSESDWIKVTYDLNIVYKDPRMVEFERPLTGVLHPFNKMRKIDDMTHSYLIIGHENNPETESHLAVIGPNGGYVAGGYTHFHDETLSQLKWYINPFEFFSLAFDVDDLPKPDANTLSGRRIFYSHIDGDGWRNISEIPQYKKTKTLSSEVILKEVIEPFPDIPVTVAPIVGDIDPEWYGSQESLKLARTILSLPQVEAGSHTYSHPLNWNFFADDNAANELPFLKYYPKRPDTKKDIFPLQFLGKNEGSENKNTRLWNKVRTIDQAKNKLATKKRKEDSPLLEEYETPRSYAVRPFDLKLEIEGSINFINTLLPSGKKVELLQWSGNTLPFTKALAESRLAGVRNINGGDTRFDREFPSYAWVAPIGRQIENQLQIYASNSNEETYTDLWKERFFGFQHLVKTIRNTETPWRIKPFNVYYHMYSGEKMSSLKAVLDNLRYARTLEIIPITTSNYAAIADGFFTTRITVLGKQQWRIENRGSLQTIRFDHGTFLAVDFLQSEGVTGQRHYQGSLYVSLDASHSSPVITLKDNPNIDQIPETETSYLVHSSWKIWNLQTFNKSFSFNAQGFGNGKMLWKVAQIGRYNIDVLDSSGKHRHLETTSTDDGILQIKLGSWALKTARISVSRSGPLQ